MKKELLKKVKVLNQSQIELTGRINECEGQNQVMFLCPGFGGAFGPLGNVFSDYAKEQGVAFFYGQFRDTYDQKKAKQFDENGNSKEITIGGSYSLLQYGDEDFDAFFNFLRKKGYEKIDVIATCISCSKLVKYLKDNPEVHKMINSVTFLALQDLELVKTRPKLAGFEDEARKNCDNGEYYKLLTEPFLGYMPISSLTYLDLCFNEEYNTLPYITDHEKLSVLQEFDFPMFFVLAELDGAIKRLAPDIAETSVKLCAQNCRRGYFSVIKDSSHLFEGKEDIVVKEYDKFFKEVNSENIDKTEKEL